MRTLPGYQATRLRGLTRLTALTALVGGCPSERILKFLRNRFNDFIIEFLNKVIEKT